MKQEPRLKAGLPCKVRPWRRLQTKYFGAVLISRLSELEAPLGPRCDIQRTAQNRCSVREAIQTPASNRAHPVKLPCWGSAKNPAKRRLSCKIWDSPGPSVPAPLRAETFQVVDQAGSYGNVGGTRSSFSHLGSDGGVGVA